MLLSFALWAEFGLKKNIDNVLELRRVDPKEIKNPALNFVLPRAMDNVVERSVLEVCQAWELLNKKLKEVGLRTIGTTNRDYQHLKRIRNKLVAHRIENLVVTYRHLSWYRRTYGDFESVLGLVKRVAQRVAIRINDLERKGHLWSESITAGSPAQVRQSDLRALINAAKAHGIN